MNSKIAYCYFPTTAVFVDDNKNFLDGLILELGDHVPTRMFQDPRDAFPFLKASTNEKSSHLPILEKSQEDLSEKAGLSTVDIDVSGIYKQIYSSERFNKISVVVVDYAMPSQDGLEFAKQIRKNCKDLKIVMLTGEATDKLAIEAFNEGAIDRFIKKSSSNFTTTLNKTIYELQKEYFCDLSKSTVLTLAVNQNCCLGDEAFISFFNKLIRQKNIVEYYLVDELGSFLLLDTMGNHSFLVVKSDSVVNAYSDIAQDNDDPMNIVNALKNREKIPFFFTSEDEERSVENWDVCLHPAEKLKGKTSDYYYALIEENRSIDINSNKIVSFQTFLSKAK